MNAEIPFFWKPLGTQHLISGPPPCDGLLHFAKVYMNFYRQDYESQQITVTCDIRKL